MPIRRNRHGYGNKARGSMELPSISCRKRAQEAGCLYTVLEAVSKESEGVEERALPDAVFADDCRERFECADIL